MSFSCIDCMKKPCRTHQLDQLPKGCPTAACDPEQVLAIYSDGEKKLLRDIQYEEVKQILLNNGAILQ